MIRINILRFAKAMERTLQKNDHKGGWETCTQGYLRRRMKDEVRELDRAFKKKDVGSVKQECTDIANFAMMIFDTICKDDFEWS